LAELIKFSLIDNNRQAAINENFIDEMAFNIIIGGHLMDRSMVRDLPKRTIVFNTEQFGQGPESWKEVIFELMQKFVAWDYSAINVDLFKSAGVKSIKHFEIGYHDKLKRIPGDLKKKIDVFFYGVLTKNRLVILDELEKRGLRVEKIEGIYGRERDYLISRSNIILNLHAHPTKIFEIIRVHYLMNNAKAVVCQVDNDTKIDSRYLEGISFSRYENLVEKCIELIENKNLIRELEIKSIETIRKINSKQAMAKMIEDLH
jgi:hypothetical protein